MASDFFRYFAQGLAGSLPEAIKFYLQRGWQEEERKRQEDLLNKQLAQKQAEKEKELEYESLEKLGVPYSVYKSKFQEELAKTPTMKAYEKSPLPEPPKYNILESLGEIKPPVETLNITQYKPPYDVMKEKALRESGFNIATRLAQQLPKYQTPESTLSITDRYKLKILDSLNRELEDIRRQESIIGYGKDPNLTSRKREIEKQIENISKLNVYPDTTPTDNRIKSMLDELEKITK